MRILLLALMIALLPLRGWVGDVMAMEMAGQMLSPEIAIKSVANDGLLTGHGTENNLHHAAMAMPDCHGHSALPADGTPAGEAAPAHGSDCSAHAVCQLCHSVALTPMPLLLLTRDLPAASPRTALARFTSVEPGPGFKPPIFCS